MELQRRTPMTMNWLIYRLFLFWVLFAGLDLSGSLQGAGGIGGLLAMTEASSTHSYYHSAGNGNVTTLINANQLVVARRSYEPFGATLSLSGPKAGVNPYWFSSELHDSDLDFYHYPHRVYIPALQRFASRDPLGEDGGINLFGFVGNNPISRIDPLGESDFNAPPMSVTGGYVNLVGNFNYQPLTLNLNRIAPLNLSTPVSQPTAVLTAGDPNAVPYVPEQRRNLFTYDTLLIGSDLAGTQVGEQIADFNAAIYSALLPLPRVSRFANCPVAAQSVRVLDHGLRHFPAGSQQAVKEAITADAQALKLAPGQAAQRTITVGGQQVSYRAMGLPNGTISVGTATPGTYVRDISAPR